MAYYIEEKTIKMTADNLIQKKKKWNTEIMQCHN